LIQEAVLQFRFADDESPLVVAHVGHGGAFRVPFVLDGNYILTVSATPDDDQSQHYTYKLVELNLSVHGDVNGLKIIVPVASTRSLVTH